MRAECKLDSDSFIIWLHNPFNDSHVVSMYPISRDVHKIMVSQQSVFQRNNRLIQVLCQDSEGGCMKYKPVVFLQEGSSYTPHRNFARFLAAACQPLSPWLATVCAKILQSTARPFHPMGCLKLSYKVTYRQLVQE